MGDAWLGSDPLALERGGAAPLRPDELAGLQILQGVSVESIWGLLEHCPVRELRAGEQLLAKGESNQTLYLLLAGRLSVHLQSPEEQPVAVLEAGVTVGELSVIDDSPASAYVLAAAPTRLLAVDEETFWRLVRASHVFAANLLSLLARRMRATNTTAAERQRQAQEFERASLVDGLTGLNNRRWLAEKLPRIIQRLRQDQAPIALIMVDIDHFKRFNDEHGHHAGDAVLRAVAEVISTRLRPLDIGVRYGGEELLVVLPHTDLGGATSAAERLRAMVQETRAHDRDDRSLPTITVSCGVAQVQPDEEATATLERADRALYRAKRLGRNRVEVSF